MKPIINLLEVALNGSSLKQKAIANNIANVDTPEYKREDVNFTEVLKRVMRKSINLNLKTTDEDHIKMTGSTEGIAPAQVVKETATSFRNDGNNVDIDYEMAELAKNNLYYNTLIGQLSSRFKILNDVIEKGGR